MGCSCSGCPEGDIADGVIVIVEVPEGVTMAGGVTGGGGVTAELPLPQPAAYNTEHRKIAVRALLLAKRLPLAASSNIQRFFLANTKTRAIARRINTRISSPGTKGPGIEGGSTAAPLVDTVTVNSAGAPLAIATVAGTWHVAPSGAPEQASDTVPL